ncbi:MAG: type I-C CRISPR-associated protein Cas8c/Csd1 [Synergistaceae bacterium]|jgi:CRISPR-associated protein Csd1|nr:type I-C CRISPR-associated protein Cas8c/Csd1 [Synergistaceae bacterium]
MSWLRKLYDTYEKTKHMNFSGEDSPPLPLGHAYKQAHIEITVDGDGNFLRASVVKKEETRIPVTEISSCRTSNGAPHPLCDKIQYVAGDYTDCGGEKRNYFDDFKSGAEALDGYLTILNKWREASGNHPKLRAVHEYVKKRRVVRDLVDEKALYLDDRKRLMKSWPDREGEPAIFKVLTKKSGKIDQGDAFVRWRVSVPGDREDRVWCDEELAESWIRYNMSLQENKGLCFVIGEVSALGSLHPARIRHEADGAKLISSNDDSGFTYRGRFTDSNQACSIGYEASQKAHNALRWLVRRQGWHNDSQVIVAWEVSGKSVPKLMENSSDASLSEFMAKEGIDFSSFESEEYSGDMGQAYARQLNKKIGGYRAELGDRGDIVVMAMDSSTPGRMAITYYRELSGSEFLARVEKWHESYAWFQNYKKDLRFVGAPSPKDIAAAAYGRRLDAKLCKSAVSRILPCIVDDLPISKDLEKSVFKRTINRVSLEFWEWEKNLGISCGLYRGLHRRENYKMALEPERRSRDYLYGRLLAAAEWTEQIALFVANERRDTNAAKLLHRFAEKPFSTWRQMELALIPYKSRLRGSRAPFLNNMDNLMDEIHGMFDADDYTDNSPLSGEFLLGYHCQRRDLKSKAKDNPNMEDDIDIDQERED